ncbi:MAG: hypothetical protein AB7N65_11595 [Vicinamibacterales bacterium]
MSRTHVARRTRWLARGVLPALMAACLAACDARTDVERQREAAVREAEQEPLTPPLAGLRRTGSLTLADRRAWLPILQWPTACEEAFQTSHAGDDGGITFHPLAPGLTTVDVICAAGAYQPSHVFLRLDERGSSPTTELLRFPALVTEDGLHVEPTVETEIAGEAVVSDDGEELAVLAFSRQTRDCGIWSRFSITGTHPRLVDAAASLPCPSTPSEPVAGWTSERPPAGWRPQPIDTQQQRR